MSEPTPPTAPAPSPAPRSSSWKYTLIVIVLLVAGGAAYYVYVRSQNPIEPPFDELKPLKVFVSQLASSQRLADGYVDADKDLVADTPKDADKLLKIGDELTFTTVGTDKPAESAEEWKAFMAALEKATGVKKVRYLDDVRTIEDQYKAVREGRLHVTGFNTGAVPTAVNTAGFVPMFVPADKDGKFAIEMQILVRADSPIKGPADLRGKEVAFVAFSSNSGAKAPLVVLKEDFGLTPYRDYKVVLTGDHKRSIRQLVAGQHDAVCVASDMASELATTKENPVDPSKYKAIYKSQPLPPLCFGVPHNMPPDTRAKVAKAFAEFKFDDKTAVGQKFSAQGKTGFVPINYKNDWEFVRRIDDTITRMFDRE